MKKGRYSNGKLEFYVPRYRFMKMSNGRPYATGSTEPKIVYYDIEGDSSKLEEGKRYAFEIINEEKKIVKIVHK